MQCFQLVSGCARVHVCSYVGSYVQQSGPFQRMVHRVPQTHLPVLCTGEEQVFIWVRGQTPQLICVTLRDEKDGG